MTDNASMLDRLSDKKKVQKLAVGAHMITCADFKKRIDYDFQNEAPQELVMDFEDLKKKPKASSVKTCMPMKSIFFCLYAAWLNGSLSGRSPFCQQD